MKSERFTPLYEWLSSFPDITQNEALVISRVKMWGQQGCFESYTRMAKFLKMDRGTVIRVVKKCVDKEYLLRLDDTKNKRFLHFNHDRFTPELMKGGGVAPPVESAGGGVAPPEVVAPRHPTIYSQDRKRHKRSLKQDEFTEETKFLTEGMTIQPDISRATQLQNRRREIRTQGDRLLAEERKHAETPEL